MQCAIRKDAVYSQAKPCAGTPRWFQQVLFCFDTELDVGIAKRGEAIAIVCCLVCIRQTVNGRIRGVVVSVSEVHMNMALSYETCLSSA